MVWFFFFKQKTAYEMRISDWSSDVCSSDLETLRRRIDADTAAHAALNDRFAADAADRRAHELRRRRWDRWWNGALAGFALLVPVALGYGYHLGNGAGEASGYARASSEERRVGKEWVSTCRSRGSTDH